MILANITSFIGQCAGAVHYYCYIEEVANTKPEPNYKYANHEELTYELTDQNAADKINSKEGRRSYHVGMEINRFDTIEDIHKLLLNKYPDQTIISYYERKPFKDMLYYIDGEDKTFVEFGEIYQHMPSQCYKDLLPNLNTIKIKCADCGRVYSYTQLFKREWESESGRVLVQFKQKRDMDSPCCKWFDLEWNVVL